MLRALEQAAAEAEPQGTGSGKPGALPVVHGRETTRPNGVLNQLARRAADQEPTAARWLLASGLSDEALREAAPRGQSPRALAPNDPDVILAHAQLVSQGPSGERALAMLEALPDTGVDRGSRRPRPRACC